MADDGARPTDAETRIADLQAEVGRQAAELDALRMELSETNQGVVALYAELDDQARQLRDASELKSRFLSYMSHEFRTPLGSIQSMTRILLDELDGPLTAEQTKQVQFVRTATIELADMVNDLLDLAKVEAGRVVISPAWFEMVDLFSALRGMFKPILSSDSVSLVFEEPQGVSSIFTDDKKLSQILRNFIANALKFTTQGEVRITARPEGDMVTFAVSDTGIGIAPEYLQVIFDDFVQVDSPLQRRLRGTGLGLPLSRKLATLLGGRVEVQSSPGRGSVFSVTIPRELPTASDAGGAASPQPEGVS